MSSLGLIYNKTPLLVFLAAITSSTYGIMSLVSAAENPCKLIIFSSPEGGKIESSDGKIDGQRLAFCTIIIHVPNASEIYVQTISITAPEGAELAPIRRDKGPVNIHKYPTTNNVRFHVVGTDELIIGFPAFDGEEYDLSATYWAVFEDDELTQPPNTATTTPLQSPSPTPPTTSLHNSTTTGPLAPNDDDDSSANDGNDSGVSALPAAALISVILLSAVGISIGFGTVLFLQSKSKMVRHTIHQEPPACALSLPSISIAATDPSTIADDGFIMTNILRPPL